jgi:3-hydroxyacyl-CoA dehydrogenase/enoyl-CoA hydratase/3-hydroxybutyryl-CoA epimerase/3-hydroxyacyl-CoA dehydrogenase/enoyl-CoA hydratase/3-hydroxybutyryl-CoA epimerase/enoyl-CoA isomerase
MADTSILTLDFPAPDIARLTFDDPAKGANILSSAVLDDLEQHLNELEQRTDLAGLIFRSAKPGVFIAGADLREFVQWLDSPPEEVQAFCRRGQTLFARFTQAPFVTVAAIDGVCLGGGAELAVWCDHRLMTDNPKTQYGFPEVKLGLYPGWGGTARTPRIIGLSNAVELITSGEAIVGPAAYKLGLAVEVVKPEQLDQAAIELVRQERASGEYKQNRERWSQSLPIDDTELAFLGATGSAHIQQQTGGHYPAPLVALEVMLEASSLDVSSACAREAEGFPSLFGSPVNRSLLNVFFLQDKNKKDPGIDNPEVKPRPIRSASVIGAGIMGQGIAAANVKRKIPTTLTDLSPEALAHGISGILEEVSYSKATKAPDARKAIELTPYLNGSTSPAEVAAADLVIEAVIENLDIKQKVYADLEPRLGPETILASNTSTIPISKLAAGLEHPERFCGLHFFNPVRKMPLVEVIRGAKTSDETVATLVAYAKSIGKSPIVVGDGPGFLVNRILLPYMTESVQLLLEGAAVRHFD